MYRVSRYIRGTTVEVGRYIKEIYRVSRYIRGATVEVGRYIKMYRYM